MSCDQSEKSKQLWFNRMIFLSQFNMENFIDKVRLYPCLWDMSHILYRDTGKKDLAWERIARDCGMANGKDAKAQWKKLRDSHREALRRRKSLGQAGVNLQPWKYEAAMAFLLSQTDNKNNSANTTNNSDNSHNTSTELPLSPSESPLPAEPDRNRRHTDISQEREKRREERLTKRDELRRQVFDINRGQDALSNLFVSLCQKTRDLPRHLQLRVQREIFDTVSRAEEEALSFDLMGPYTNYQTSLPDESTATRPQYTSSPEDDESNPLSDDFMDTKDNVTASTGYDKFHEIEIEPAPFK